MSAHASRLAALVIALVCALAPAAHAEDTFEARADGAIRFRRLDDLVWAVTTPCDQGDDVAQRQCRQIRDRKVKSIAGATLIVDGDSDAFELGRWNAAKKSVSVTLAACVRCGGVEVDGRTWHVMGTGTAPRFEGGKLRVGMLHDNARAFSDEASAIAWIKSVKSHKVQLLVKVPDKRRFQVAGKDGIQLEITGWRVINPCDGSIVIASPASQSVAPDRQACSAGGGEGVAASDGAEVLTPSMVQDAMKPVVEAANACFERLGVAGKAKLEISINGDGTVARYDQSGDFEGTPTGQCIDTAMRKVQFPKTKKPKTKIGYPIVLQ
ncbi:MAG: hypothetical protein H6Q90_2930 [Deltaproteobacteria bacterium]|nr:hypothetical protein [Deltaproteobacteria bacterium]